jgi:DNA repair protein RadC
LESPAEVKNYLTVKFQRLEHEVFSLLLMDNRHRLVECRELFRGTIDCAPVYAREVVKTVLSVNAAAVIFVHNHPSGLSEPSAADMAITRKLCSALEIIDVRVSVIARHTTPDTLTRRCC